MKQSVICRAVTVCIILFLRQMGAYVCCLIPIVLEKSNYLRHNTRNVPFEPERY